MRSQKERRAQTFVAIVRRREQELAKDIQGSPVRRPLRAEVRPTPEEVINPHRTIRNLKMLICVYQRDQEMYGRTLNSLSVDLAKILKVPLFDPSITPGNVIRSAVRRMARKVATTKTRLSAGGSKGATNRHAKEAATLKVRDDKIIRYARSCRQDYSLTEFLGLAASKWPNLGRRQLREIVSTVYPKNKARAKS